MSKPRSSRMRKVDELLREVIAEEVALLKDPRIGFVTVTGVVTSPDLRRATVFYSVLGDDEARTETAAGLATAAPRLQGRLASQVRLKFTPLLEFEIDPAIETGLRMGEILHRLEEESSATPNLGDPAISDPVISDPSISDAAVGDGTGPDMSQASDILDDPATSNLAEPDPDRADPDEPDTAEPHADEPDQEPR